MTTFVFQDPAPRSVGVFYDLGVLVASPPNKWGALLLEPATQEVLARAWHDGAQWKFGPRQVRSFAELTASTPTEGEFAEIVNASGGVVERFLGRAGLWCVCSLEFQLADGGELNSMLNGADAITANGLEFSGLVKIGPIGNFVGVNASRVELRVGSDSTDGLWCGAYDPNSDTVLGGGYNKTHTYRASTISGALKLGTPGSGHAPPPLAKGALAHLTFDTAPFAHVVGRGLSTLSTPRMVSQELITSAFAPTHAFVHATGATKATSMVFG